MTTTRLSASDWVDVGFTFLGDEGIQGIKIDRMAERLGVTKGSFYWHFKDLDDFLFHHMDKYYSIVKSTFQAQAPGFLLFGSSPIGSWGSPPRTG